MNYKEKALSLIEEKYDEIRESKRLLIEDLAEKTQSGKLKICLFGTGLVGKGFLHDLAVLGIKTSYFCDNAKEKWNTEIKDGVMCISPDKLKEIYEKENLLVVLSLGAVNEVYAQMKAMGIHNVIKHPFDLLAEPQNKWTKVPKEEVLQGVGELFDVLEDDTSKEIALWKVSAWFMMNEELKALDYGKIYTHDEYVPADIMKLQGRENMVDCGGFTGDTLEYFINEVGYSDFERYTCFELSKFNFEKMEERVRKYPKEIQDRVTLINKGVADKNETIYYTGEISGTHIDSAGETEGQITYLDYVLKNQPVSYIKMDIEGSEMNALIGGGDLYTIKQAQMCHMCLPSSYGFMEDTYIFEKTCAGIQDIFQTSSNSSNRYRLLCNYP